MKNENWATLWYKALRLARFIWFNLGFKVWYIRKKTLGVFAKFLYNFIEYEEIFLNFAHYNVFAMDDLKYNRMREVLVSRGIKQTWLAQQIGLSILSFHNWRGISVSRDHALSWPET